MYKSGRIISSCIKPVRRKRTEWPEFQDLQKLYPGKRAPCIGYALFPIPIPMRHYVFSLLTIRSVHAILAEKEGLDSTTSTLQSSVPTALKPLREHSIKVSLIEEALVKLASHTPKLDLIVRRNKAQPTAVKTHDSSEPNIWDLITTFPEGHALT